MSNVVLLRSTPPLFKAYEEVYSILESKYCPSFFKSEEYFTFLLGKREMDNPEGSERNTTKMWKMWFNNIRKQLPFVHTPHTKKATQKSLSRFYIDNNNVEE